VIARSVSIEKNITIDVSELLPGNYFLKTGGGIINPGGMFVKE
jgi:hypothetical protein